MIVTEYRNGPGGDVLSSNQRQISLIQPWWHYGRSSGNDRWDVDALEDHVATAERADVVVFPECYPWSTEVTDERTRDIVWLPEEHWPVAFAQEKLRGIAKRRRRQIIAGGVLRDGEGLYNTLLYAVPNRAEVQVYCKRILWDRLEEENFTAWPIERSVGFEFDGRVIIPLICADVLGPKGGRVARQKKMRDEVRRSTVALARQHPGAPILVCAYAGAPQFEPWTTRLQELANEANTDVLFCNVAGNDGRGYGGGASGVFIPGKRSRRLGNEPGVFRYID